LAGDRCHGDRQGGHDGKTAKSHARAHRFTSKKKQDGDSLVARHWFEKIAPRAGAHENGAPTIGARRSGVWFVVTLRCYCCVPALPGGIVSVMPCLASAPLSACARVISAFASAMVAGTPVFASL